MTGCTSLVMTIVQKSMSKRLNCQRKNGNRFRHAYPLIQFIMQRLVFHWIQLIVQRDRLVLRGAESLESCFRPSDVGKTFDGASGMRDDVP